MGFPEALDSADVEASLVTIATRFLDLVLSPEAIALNRIIIAEVIRFPALGAVFWAAGPERTRAQHLESGGRGNSFWARRHTIQS